MSGDIYANLRMAAWREALKVLAIQAAGVLIVAAVSLIPLDSYKSLIEEKASAAIGRKVSIKGPMSVSVLTGLSASISGIEIEKLATIGNVKGTANIGA